MAAPLNVHLVAAARPNFMKIAPAWHALRATGWCRPVLIHTGQHYDNRMSDTFLEELQLPAPDFHLGVGSGSHAEQTGRVMIAYEKVCQEDRPDWTIVAGDVNSTLACALTARKLHVRLAHLEAGLRSRDWRMPEEINRLATDAISDLLWTPSPDADENLAREGIPADRIDRIGNIMLDSRAMMRERIEAEPIVETLGLTAGHYGVVTLHRPSNVDDPATLRLLVGTLCDIARRLPLVFAVHPRTLDRLESAGLLDDLAQAEGMVLTEPLGYVAFSALVRHARLVLTDSGGIQEETTWLGIPCLTLRDNTERPVTITLGTNRLVAPADVGRLVDVVLSGGWQTGRRPDLWDGQTAGRLAASLKKHAGR